MRRFQYTISDPLGIHARPAGMIAKAARQYPDTMVTIERDGQSARATQLMKLMGMGIRQGDQIVVTAEGTSEAEAAQAMEQVFRENL